MKKLTTHVFAIAFAVIIFSATYALAQKRITLNNDGKATINATIKPWKLEESSSKNIWSISGKDFSNLSIKQTRGGKFKYEIRRGGEFLSSGHTTGSNIQINSDGKSTYTLTITNEEDEAGSITLSVTNSGE